MTGINGSVDIMLRPFNKVALRIKPDNKFGAMQLVLFRCVVGSSGLLLISCYCMPLLAVLSHPETGKLLMRTKYWSELSCCPFS